MSSVPDNVARELKASLATCHGERENDRASADGTVRCGPRAVAHIREPAVDVDQSERGLAYFQCRALVQLSGEVVQQRFEQDVVDAVVERLDVRRTTPRPR